MNKVGSCIGHVNLWSFRPLLLTTVIDHIILESRFCYFCISPHDGCLLCWPFLLLCPNSLHTLLWKFGMKSKLRRVLHVFQASHKVLKFATQLILFQSFCLRCQRNDTHTHTRTLTETHYFHNTLTHLSCLIKILMSYWIWWFLSWKYKHTQLLTKFCLITGNRTDVLTSENNVTHTQTHTHSYNWYCEQCRCEFRKTDAGVQLWYHCLICMSRCLLVSH